MSDRPKVSSFGAIIFHMTEISDIPSVAQEQLRDNRAFFIAAAVIASLFFLSITVLASELEEEQSSVSTGGNAQTIKLIAPDTFDLPRGFGGAQIATIDDALLGNRSALDGYDGGFAELTGHTTNLYIVREGDTISTIAESFGVSQNTIMWANDLSAKKTIRVGQKLIILPVSGVIHTVKKGDTIDKIAKTYDGDIQEILTYNRITANELTVGEEITVPGGIIKRTTTSTRSIAQNSSSQSSGVVRRTGGSLKTVRSPSGLLEVTTGISYTWKNGVRTSQLRGTGGPTYTNYYIRPINGYGKSRGLHGFNSVDFAAPQGTPILASASGKVIIARGSGWNGGYGKYLAIEHSNGTQTLYAHMSSVAVSQGSNVVQGQVIGYVGSTGNSTGSHLHFEVRGARNPF